MSFFRRRDQLQRNTSYLIGAFLLAYLLVIFAFSLLIVGFIALFTTDPVSVYWQKALIAATCLGLAVIFIETSIKMVQLRNGSSAVMAIMNAVEVDELNGQALVRRFVNVVQELSISAQMQVPRIYVLPLAEINALAVASNKEDGSIAVTQGALLHLNREELQGMVAHELSHLLHEDCILNFRLIAWLHGLQALYLVGRDLLDVFGGKYPKTFDQLGLGYARGAYMDHSDRAEIIPIVVPFITVLGWIFLIVGFTGALGARMIKSRISREREYLADTEAVRMTRHTALAQVLMKIAKLSENASDVVESQRVTTIEMLSHFYLADYVARKGWFNTHPPILLRIKAIDPHFIPSHLVHIDLNAMDPAMEETTEAPEMAESHSNAALSMGEWMGFAAETISMRESLLNLSKIDINKDVSNINAVGLCCALLLRPEPEILKKQFDLIAKTISGNIANYTKQIYVQKIRQLPARQRLPLITKVLPSLAAIDSMTRMKTKRCLYELIQADGNVSMFEYSVWRLLDSTIKKIESPAYVLDFVKQEDELYERLAPTSQLLSILAKQGYQNQNIAKKRYEIAWHYLNFPKNYSYNHDIDWLKHFDSILIDLEVLSPKSNKLLLEAMIKLLNGGECLQEGKDAIYIVCLILKLELPNFTYQ